MSHLKVPFSAFHGSGDRVTSYHGSEKLLREAGSTDKELKLYEDVRPSPISTTPSLTELRSTNTSVRFALSRHSFTRL